MINYPYHLETAIVTRRYIIDYAHMLGWWRVGFCWTHRPNEFRSLIAPGRLLLAFAHVKTVGCDSPTLQRVFFADIRGDRLDNLAPADSQAVAVPDSIRAGIAQYERPQLIHPVAGSAETYHMKNCEAARIEMFNHARRWGYDPGAYQSRYDYVDCFGWGNWL
jgi:hypothetical protein